MEPKSIIFMKAGPHSGYTLDEIFKIKKTEEKAYGKLFWGYAGALCHPFRVHTFVKQSLRDYEEVPMLVMTTTSSKYYSKKIGKLKEHSVDGDTYHPLPQKVILIGCKYAVIVRDLQQTNSCLDLNQYKVVDGKEETKLLGNYIRYRVNKACAVRSLDISVSPRYVKISYIAKLTAPWCVFLR